MTDLATQLARACSAAFEAEGLAARWGAVKQSDRPELADFQCNGCMGAAKSAGLVPRDLAAKIAHRDTAMRAWVAGFDSRAALCAELDRLEIAWADVRDGATIHDSPTVAHRGVFTTVDSGAGGERRRRDEGAVRA